MTEGQRIPPSKEQGAIVLVVFLAIIAVGTWVACRLVAFFPLIVINERLSVREAWRLSRRNAWRILGVFFFGALPIMLAGIIVSLALMPFLGLVGPRVLAQGGAEAFVKGAAIMGTINVVVNFIFGIPAIAVGVAILCYCFKALAGYGPDDIVPSRARNRYRDAADPAAAPGIPEAGSTRLSTERIPLRGRA